MDAWFHWCFHLSFIIYVACLYKAIFNAGIVMDKNTDTNMKNKRILNSSYRPKEGWTNTFIWYEIWVLSSKVSFYNRPKKNFRFKVRQTNFPFHIMSLILTKLYPKEIVFCKSFLLSKISKVVYRSQIFASFALWTALWVSVLAAFFISDDVFRVITL